MSNNMEKKILGVALWSAKKLNMDLSIARVLWVLAAILSFGTAILVYFVVYLLLEFKVVE
jgi:phage shock protein PspC (stress-responsive transcriptional regulator)